jgi:hypothetical protein
MKRFASGSRSLRRLVAGVATTALAALCFTAAPAAAAPNDDGPFLLQNGAFTTYVLCANKDNDAVFVTPIADSAKNTYCQWKQIGSDNQFKLANLGKGAR